MKRTTSTQPMLLRAVVFRGWHRLLAALVGALCLCTLPKAADASPTMQLTSAAMDATTGIAIYDASVGTSSYSVRYFRNPNGRPVVEVKKGATVKALLEANPQTGQLVGTLDGQPAVFDSNRSQQVLPSGVDGPTNRLLELDLFNTGSTSAAGVAEHDAALAGTTFVAGFTWSGSTLFGLVDGQYEDDADLSAPLAPHDEDDEDGDGDDCVPPYSEAQCTENGVVKTFHCHCAVAMCTTVTIPVVGMGVTSSGEVVQVTINIEK